MRTTPVILMLTLFFVSCTKEHSAPATGIYKGSFRREMSGGINKGAVAVTITLKDGRFSGTSEDPHYPAIGFGRYTLDNETIQFVNESVFTADFDWTLILNDRFNRTTAGDSIVWIRNEGDFVLTQDIYTLKKQ